MILLVPKFWCDHNLGCHGFIYMVPQRREVLKNISHEIFRNLVQCQNWTQCEPTFSKIVLRFFPLIQINRLPQEVFSNIHPSVWFLGFSIDWGENCKVIEYPDLSNVLGTLWRFWKSNYNSAKYTNCTPFNSPPWIYWMGFKHTPQPSRFVDKESFSMTIQWQWFQI